MTKTAAPLDRVRVLVTRPAQQAEELCRLLTMAGARVFRFPGLVIEPIPDSATLAQGLAQLPAQELLVFTSANAVTGFRDCLTAHGLPLPAQTPCAAVGQRTGERLRQLGMGDVTVAPAPYTSEALLAQPLMQGAAGRKAMLISGVGGRGILAESLQRQGNHVTLLEVYRRVLPQADPAPLQVWLKDNHQAGGMGTIIVTSGEILENLQVLAGEPAGQALLKANLVTVSSRIRELARRRGFSGTITLSEPNDAALVRTIVGWWHQTETQANP